MITFEKIWLTYTVIAWGWLFFGCFTGCCSDAGLDEGFMLLVAMPVIIWLIFEFAYFILKFVLFIWGINFDLFPSICLVRS